MNKKKSHKILPKAAFFAVLSAALTVFTYFYAALPANITAEVNSVPGGNLSAASIKSSQNDENCTFFLGNIPIKEANVSYKARSCVIPGGMPFGIKIRSEGVMIISTAENSPAKKAGIRPGDVILSVNGEEVHTNSEISEKLNSCETAMLVLRRGSSEFTVGIDPEPDGIERKIGAYVRDSAAGIGTLTFYDPEHEMFGGLGHPVSDATTGEAVPLGAGEITKARIYGVIAGHDGTAGELCGLLLPGSDIGEIASNTPSGVFGTLAEPLSGDPLPVAFKQEVHTGSASILTTVDGETPQKYSIEIERINLLDLSGSKAMVIKITDPELLSLTGGIVRGMSGSPIIQDGMLVGAVTHVLVNDPTRGYAIFAETMLSEVG